MIDAIVATTYLLWIVTLWDMMDANNFNGWLHDRGEWFRSRNRWRLKYKNTEGPFNWTDRKWWAKLGLDSFLTFWHSTKLVMILSVIAGIVFAAGLRWYWILILLVVQHAWHQFVVWGRLR